MSREPAMIRHRQRVVRGALVLLVPASAFGQQPPAKAPQEPPPIMADRKDTGELLRLEEPKIQARIKRIDAEVAALDRAALKDTDWAKEWAGEYYEGDGLGTNVDIHLAPQAGIGFLNYGCLGLYGGDQGDIVEALPDGLRLKLVLGKQHGSFLSERVYFVKWGDERFLVPDWALMRMVNNYNEGSFARSSMYGIPRLRRGASRGTVRAKPPPANPNCPRSTPNC